MSRILAIGTRVEVRWGASWIPGRVVALYPPTVGIMLLGNPQRRKLHCYREIAAEGRDWRWPVEPSDKGVTT